MFGIWKKSGLFSSHAVASGIVFGCANIIAISIVSVGHCSIGQCSVFVKIHSIFTCDGMRPVRLLGDVLVRHPVGEVPFVLAKSAVFHVLQCQVRFKVVDLLFQFLAVAVLAHHKRLAEHLISKQFSFEIRKFNNHPFFFIFLFLFLFIFLFRFFSF
ncbi:MAG: hypothetical protein EB120_13825 [Proteobacteria bacterium]|nr:hypothetical protein [Pseudomonadota bacterium]